LIPLFMAASAKGTSFLIGDSGIVSPLREIDGISILILGKNEKSIWTKQ
jgi:hypothetical protein